MAQSFVFIVVFPLPDNATWSQSGTTVAGGNGRGSAINQLCYPRGLNIDDDNQSIVIADTFNHRIVEWKMGAMNGTVIAGGQGGGSRLDQLSYPTSVLIDKENKSLLIADQANQRVLRWSRRQGTTQGEVIVDNIHCWDLAMDHQRYLYVSDTMNHDVRRYAIGDKNGTVVAGGNGKGNQLNQFDTPTNLFIDDQEAVYVSDHSNHRVMKWNKGASQGIVVAGGQGPGNATTQFHYPLGIFVDTSGTLYVADSDNHRVMRLPKGAAQGTVIAGGNGKGNGTNQFNRPEDLSFDHQGKLYVADWGNDRVQRFDIQ